MHFYYASELVAEKLAVCLALVAQMKLTSAVAQSTSDSHRKMPFAVYRCRIAGITANLYRVLNEPKTSSSRFDRKQKVIIDNLGHSTKNSAAKCARVRAFPILINSNQWIYVASHKHRPNTKPKYK